MSTISSLSSTGSTSGSPDTLTNPNASLTPNDFIQMMVTELKNQDPLNPTSNEDLLSQMSEIGQLQSSDTLQTSLQSMVLQNSIGSASSLIGKAVKGQDASGNPLSGTVNSIQVQNNSVLLQLDSGQSLPMSNVTSIMGAPTSTGAATTGSTTPATAAAN